MIVVKTAHRAKAIAYERMTSIAQRRRTSRHHVPPDSRIKRFLIRVTDVSDVDVSVFRRVCIHQVIGKKRLELIAVSSSSVLLVICF